MRDFLRVGLGDKVKVIVQRCLWHIPHQLKYCLWQDKVKQKSEAWKKVLKQLINHCFDNGYARCATYLANAAPDMFNAFEKKLNGKTTSLVERVMRIVNFRINVGKRTEKGALNVNKIRLTI